MPGPVIDGLQPQQEQQVRQLLAAMAPTALPNRLVFLPAKQYTNFARQVEMGRMGNRNVAAGQGSDEQYGNNHTIIGDGMSAVDAGQTWLNADLLKHPDRLSQILAHELGHYHAAATGGNASEDTANKQRDIYVKRAQVANRIWQGVDQLPVSTGGTPAVLSGMLQGVSQAIARHING